MMDDESKIKMIEELVRKEPEVKITTSMLCVNVSDLKDENEVRELVEKSETLIRDGDEIKVKE